MASQTFALPPRGDESDGLWLLSLDGGGVRGLSTLYILRNIMARLNQTRRGMQPPLPAVKPCDVFDLIGGTSTGGIIAIMLGRLEMDVQPCIDTYQKLIKTLFKNKSPFSIDWRGNLKGKFSSKLLKSSIDDVVADMGHSGTDPLNDKVERKCKVFVCARAVETNSTSRLRSYDLPHEPYVGVAPTITQAAMATSAAVSFFDPVQVGNRNYVDAGLGTNNPVDEVEEEACEIWCRKKRVGELQTRTACFVSIGTGHPGNKPINDRVDKFLMKTLREIATETETTARKSENKWAQQLENKTYFRFNVDHGLDEVGLEEFAKEGAIESVTDNHLKIRKIQIDLDSCTKALASKQYAFTIKQPCSTSDYLLELYHPSRFLRISTNWAMAHGHLCDDIFTRISDYEPDRVYSAIRYRRCKGTTMWFLNKIYKEHPSWRRSSTSCLWLSGPIGSGKPFIASTVVEQISASQFVGHFFYRPSDCDKMTASALFRALIPQMIAYLDALNLRCATEIKSSLTRYFGVEGRPPTLNEIFNECFLRIHSFMTAHGIPTLYLIDGLHECEVNETTEVFRRIQELMSLGNTRIFITGREGPPTMDFGPNTFATTIRADDTREDIRTFIKWELSKQQHRILESNDRLAQGVEKALNERAHLMFLWVRLQLESIWRCKTKNEIQATLRDLPSDLNSLYAGCFSKIVSDIGLNSLRWTYCAPRPFKVAELCELLAIHPQTGSLQREQIVDKSAIIEDCFNLVYINVNDEVVLVHHSLRGFLQVATNSTIRPKWNLEKEKLDLGWLCLKYLTGPDFTLALEQRSKKVAVPYDGRTLVQQVLKVPRFLQQKPTHFAPPIRVNPQDFGVPKRQAPKSSYALNFARNTWLPLTRQIVVGTEQWQMFLDLALQPSEQFKFHPWDCQAESMQAHYCKLLGWSIANNHWPLLQALDKAEAPKPRTEIFDLPLPEYQNLLPLHLAARTQEKARGTSSQAHIFSYVLDHAVWQRDNRKYTALHHAAEVGNGACIQCMLHRRGKDVDLDTQDDHNRTALVIAALEGRHEIVQILLDLGADCDITYLVGDLSRFTERPLMGAVKNGRLSVVEILLQPGALTNARIDAFDSRNRTALHYAAEFPTKHSGPIVARLLLAGADRHWEDVSGRTALQVACNRGNVAAAHELVDSLIPKRANVIPLFIDAAIRRHDDTTVQTFIQAGGFDAAKHPLLRREGCRRLEQMPIKELQGYIRFLKDSGLDLNAVDVEGYTPLMRAMRMPYQKLTNVLLFFEDVERFSRSEDGNTPLHIAITKLGLDDLLVGRLFKPPMSDDCVELDISNLRGLTPLSLLLIHRDVRPLIHAERWRSVLAAGRLKTALKAIPNYRFSQDENIAHMIQQAVINLQYILSIVTLGTLHVVFTISNRDHDLGEVERIERMFTRMGGGSRSALPRCRCESHATWESFRFDVGTIIKGAGLLVCLVPEKARLSHLEEAATSSSGPTPEAEYIRDRA